MLPLFSVMYVHLLYAQQSQLLEKLEQQSEEGIISVDQAIYYVFS